MRIIIKIILLSILAAAIIGLLVGLVYIGIGPGPIFDMVLKYAIVMAFSIGMVAAAGIAAYFIFKRDE